MKKKYVIIHAHFYQPPRENPWLEEVEREESAAPYHNWNERITEECYMPNSAARILDNKGKISEITSNYEKISFNFGPTLMSWLEKHHSDTYKTIIASDKESAKSRGGHGNAMAQVYNHSIMPLNTSRDKETQIIWGIKDFERRFGRKPEGIWFAEAAVDAESLMLAAKHGIKFTVLAPNQAKKSRPLGKAGAQWQDISGRPDTTYPYLYKPDDKHEIAIFFYDGALSLSIAFEGALFDGVKMGDRIMSCLQADTLHKSQLVTVATDGETYGHHHKFGEMALASAVATIEKNSETVRLTNYGEFLELNPPDTEIEIVEDSSWSCAHGVERWRSDCGCNTGSAPGWNQKWRAPLRAALDNLKEKLDALFESEGKKFLKSPWDARNDYVEVVLDRSQAGVNGFFTKHQAFGLYQQNVTEALKLLEMQRMSMMMYTSCGWFFSDLAGLETVQILKYAEKALELAREISSAPFDEEFIELLGLARSNVKEAGSGADIFQKQVRVLRLNPMRIAAHAVIMSALPGRTEQAEGIYCFKVDFTESSTESYLDSMLFTGVLELSSAITLETKKLTFCLLHLGAHDYNCFVAPFFEMGDYVMAKSAIMETFRKHSLPELIHAIEGHFGRSYFTLKALFEEDRRKVTERLLLDRTTQHTYAFQQFFEQDRKLMDFLAEMSAPLPAEFQMVAGYILGKRLNSLFTEATAQGDHKTMLGIFGDAKKWGVTIRPKTLEHNITAYLEIKIEEICQKRNVHAAEAVAEAMKNVAEAGIEVYMWRIQNLLYPQYKAYFDTSNKGHKEARGTPGLKKIFELFRFSTPTTSHDGN
jgi:alpha-amylase/alpha-mannosidase (GH57 family)